MRPNGELLVEHRERGVKQVLAPGSSPVDIIYRQKVHMIRMAETPLTAETLGWPGWEVLVLLQTQDKQ